MNVWYRRVHEPLYGADIVAVVCPQDELKDFLCKRHPGSPFEEWEDKPALGKKIVFEDSEGFYTFYVWVAEWDATPNVDQIAALVHEALHVTISILSKVGLVLSHDSEEAFTYYQGAIFKALYNLLSGEYRGYLRRRAGVARTSVRRMRRKDSARERLGRSRR